MGVNPNAAGYALIKMIIHVNAKPGSFKKELIKIGENEYTAYLKKQPEKGKANIELIKMIARELGVSPREVHIKNPASRKKIVEIKS